MQKWKFAFTLRKNWSGQNRSSRTNSAGPVVALSSASTYGSANLSNASTYGSANLSNASIYGSANIDYS